MQVNVAFSKLHQVVPTDFGLDFSNLKKKVNTIFFIINSFLIIRESEGNTVDKTRGPAGEDVRTRRSSKVAILVGHTTPQIKCYVI